MRKLSVNLIGRVILLCVFLLLGQGIFLSSFAQCLSQFPQNEGFESGLGDWTQDSTDDIDWREDASGTPSSSTGPSSAYEGTKYLYLEASGTYNKTARLLSPCLDFSLFQNQELSFWYHMYGSSMGSLEIQISDDDGVSWSAAVWSMSGNQGNQWYQATISLADHSGSNVRVRFVGITGTSYRSDMAIDHVTITAEEASFLDDDAGVVSFAPFGVFCPGQKEVKVDIKNYGVNTINNVTVNWEFNGVIQTPVIVNTSINSKDILQLSLGNKTFIDGENILKAFTSIPNGNPDTNTANDTLTYTVQPSISGTFTIGGVSPDYNNFTEAVQALINYGVCGPVIFDVRDGEYTEQLELGEITGVSEINTVTFQSESADQTKVVLKHSSGSSNNYVVKFNGADRIIFKNMTLRAINSTYGRVVDIEAGSEDIHFDNNEIRGSTSTSSSSVDRRALVYSKNQSLNHNIAFVNNAFKNGSYGIWMYGGSSSSLEQGIRIEGNTFENPYRTGIRLHYAEAAIISGNTISTTSGYSSYYGIYLQYVDKGMKVIQNKIYGGYGYGIYMNYCDATSGERGLIANNFIQVGGTNTAYGLYFNNVKYQNIYFNSVHITGSHLTNGRAFYFASGGNLQAENNIFANTGGGYAIYASSTSALIKSDHNDLYTSGTALGYYQSIRNTFADWQSGSGKDAASISIDPLFISETDLHTQEVSLKTSAIPITEIIYDIDGNTRHVSTPDIGADEITIQFPDNDAGIALNTLNELICPGEDNIVTGVIKNYGGIPLTSVEVHWEFNGVEQPVINWTTPIGAYGKTATVQLGNVAFVDGQQNTIRAWTNLPNGQIDANNTNNESTLSGQYGLKGTYTIGGSNPNFGTFNEAVNNLMEFGVCESVIFNVRSGTYNEQFSIGQVNGVSASNTITFKAESGNKEDVLLTHSSGSSNNYTIQLDGADWLVFKNLTLEGSNSSYCRVIDIFNGADNNLFEDNEIKNNSTNSSSNYRALLYSATNSTESNNSFKYNIFRNGSYGLYYYNNSKASGVIIENNQFLNQYSYGLYLRAMNAPLIKGNTFTSVTTNTSYYGVYGYDLDTKLRIEENKFEVKAGRGMYLRNCNASSSDRALIANNFIQVGGTSTANGIYLYSSYYLDFYYNSINITSTSTSSGQAVYVYNSGDYNFENNIFANTGGGYAFYSRSTSAVKTCNYNDLYTSGTNLGYWSNTNQATLLEWQSSSGKDANSITVDPLFVSDTDLHIQQAALSGKARPLTEVTNDIDGEQRDILAPTIGADDTNTEPDLARILAFDIPENICPLTDIEVKVQLDNYGANELVSATLNWKINDVSQTPLIWSGNLASGVSSTVLLGTTAFTSGNNTLEVWASEINGTAKVSDTLTISKRTNLTGIYTVGGTDPDYNTLNEVIADLDSNGVCGPVTINIRNGLYEEQLSIGEIQGASSVNTIVFQPESNNLGDVEIRFAGSETSENYVVQLNGADWLEIKNIVLSTNGEYGRVLDIRNGSENNLFENNSFNGAPVTSMVAGLELVYSPDGSMDNNNSFISNFFNNGTYGMYWAGQNSVLETGTVVSQNTFDNQYYAGVDLRFQENIIFEKNNLENQTNESYAAIRAEGTGKAAYIINNKIIASKGRWGIYLTGSNATASENGLIANNFIYVGGSYYAQGLLLENSSYQKVYYNNVHITGSHLTNGMAASVSGGSNIYLQNNILANSGGGYALFVPDAAGSSALIVSDYNDLYTTGTNLANWNGANAIDLTALQSLSTKETNSLSVDPQFSSPSNLHIKNIVLQGTALAVPEITEDIDGNLRDANPTPGADEFLFVPDDAGISLITVAEQQCRESVNVTTNISNFGTNTINSVKLNWEHNGVVKPVLDWSGTLNVGESLTVELGSIDLDRGENKVHVWTTIPNGIEDKQHHNDAYEVAAFEQPKLAGNYTIGGSSPDYISLTEAVNALETNGICAPVVFNFRDGEYNEQVSIGEIIGASEENIITFQSEALDSTVVVVTFKGTSSQNYTVQLNGADWLVFRYLTLKGTSSSYSRVIDILGEATHNTFEHNQIIGYNKYSSSNNLALVYSYGSETLDTYNIFKNSLFKDGGTGIYYDSRGANENGIIIQNNTFQGQSYNGISLHTLLGVEVTSNTFNMDGDGNAIYMYGGAGSKIERNKINVSNATGIVINTGAGTISNNFIIAGGTSSACGIYSQGGGYSFTYNNILVTTTDQSTSTRGLRLDYNQFTTYKTSRVENNIIVNNGGGLAVVVSDKRSISLFDYNNFYTTGSSLGLWEGANISNLTQWQSQSGKDAHSYSVDPLFISNTDLHIEEVSLFKAGKQLSYPITDIDGHPRSITPSIGADEVIQGEADAGVASIVPIVIGQQDVKIVLRNYSPDTLWSTQLNWTINENDKPNVIWSGTLAEGETDTVSLGSYSFYLDTAYSLEAWTAFPNSAVDTNVSNDTAKIINQYPGLQGIYTIGGTNPDFATFTEAVEVVVNAGGVVGPTVFEVRQGIYSEQIKIPHLSGLNQNQTLEFRSETGNKEDVILTYNAIDKDFNYTVLLDGADYVNFNNLTLQSESQVYGRVVVFEGEAKNNVVENNLIKGVQTNSSDKNMALIYTYQEQVKNLEIRNNEIKNGATGVYFLGKNSEYIPGLVIEGNVFENQASNAILLYYSEAPLIKNNTINSNTVEGYKGGLVRYSPGFQIIKNLVSIKNDGYAWMIVDSDGLAENRNTFVNNMVSIGSAGASGLYIVNTDYIDIWYNTVHLKQSESDAEAIYLHSTSFVNMNNNIFANYGGGYAFDIGTNVQFTSTDYNNFFTTGSQLGDYGIAIVDLVALQTATGQESNSLNINPGFSAVGEVPRQNQIQLNGVGIPIASVNDDFDGEPRNITNPDIGADEFAVASEDAGIVTVLGPSVPFGSGNQEVKVLLKNYGTDPLTSVNILWEVNGLGQSTFNWTGNILPGNEEEVVLGSYSFIEKVAYSIKSWTMLPNGLADGNLPNDGAEKDGLYSSLSGNFTIGGANPDFESFNDAISDLTSYGVHGIVTFNVRGGTYNEQLILPKIIGASNENRIVFQSENGDSTSVNLSWASVQKELDYTIQLNGAVGITFRKMTLEATDSDFGTVISLYEGASYNLFENCLLKGNNDSEKTLVVADRGKKEYNIFQYNHFLAGGLGVSFEGGYQGDNNNVFANNRFEKQYKGGILAKKQSELLLTGNTIESGNESQSFGYTGIEIIEGGEKTEISRNKINILPEGSDGIVISRCEGTIINPGLITNNFIVLKSGGYHPKGIDVSYSDYQYIYHNSVNIYGEDDNSAGYGLTLESGSNNRVINNILVHQAKDGVAIKFSETSVELTDHNILYTGGEKLAYLGGIGFMENLEEWQQATGMAANSIQENIIFNSNTDLHLPATIHIAAKRSGTPVGVNVDIDGDPRGALQVDIGADEAIFPNGVDWAYIQDFENGIGGDDWKQNIEDDLQWTHVGASNGEPVNVPGSRYMVLEVKRPYHVPDKTGIITGPAFDFSASRQAQLSFWYRMASPNMGRMEVQVSVDNGLSWSETIWSKYGDQGLNWNEAIVDLSPYTYTNKPVKIRFLGTSFTSLDSDMELDLIKISGSIAYDNNDAGVIASGSSQIFCPGEQEVKVKVKNYGKNILDSVNVNWEFNGELQTPVVFNTQVEAFGGESGLLTLGSKTFVEGQSSIIKAWTSYPNGAIDTLNNNDTLVFEIQQPALSGEYTIGGEGADFTNFSSAIEVLTISGICGPVIFNIGEGAYNEQLTIKEIPGASITNSILFRSASGDSTSVILTYAVNNDLSNYVLKLDGADHISFENITFQVETPLDYGRAILLENSANYNTFSNNVIIGASVENVNPKSAVIFSERESKDEFNTFENNLIQNGSSGICFESKSGLEWVFPSNIDPPHEKGNVIKGNIFENQLNASIKIAFQENPIIENNKIRNSNTAIDLYHSENGFRIWGNEIGGGNITNGIVITNGIGSPTKRALIANNAISVNGKIKENYVVGTIGAEFGILLTERSSYIDIFHNSLLTNSQEISDGAALIVDNSNNRHVRINNNIFMSGNNGRTFVIDPDAINESDYNVWHTKGDTLGIWGANYTADLKGLQYISGKEGHSLSIDPMFQSDINLHISSLLQVPLKQAGTPLEIVTTDIDGEERNLLHPDIGADESVFIPVHPDDAGIAALLHNSNLDHCSLTNDVQVVLQNYGNNTLENAVIDWEFNGVSQASVNWSGQLEAYGGENGDSDTLNLGGFTYLQGLNTFKIWVSQPNGNQDTESFNDTLYVEQHAGGLSGTYSIGGENASYKSFSDAVEHLVEYGICAPVVFEIQDGEYSEQVVINEIPGASLQNTVTFRSVSNDSSKVILQWAANSYERYTLQLDGADFCRFEQITLKSIGEKYGNAIELKGGANHNEFSNNRIIGIEDSGNSYPIYSPFDPVNLDEYNVFKNNHITGGYIGARYYADRDNREGIEDKWEKGNVFEGNLFEKHKNKAIELEYQEAPAIIKNTARDGGIYIYNAINGSKILQNIVNTKVGSGIGVMYSNGNSNKKGLIANNFITITSGNGIQSYKSEYQNFYYNSVQVNSESRSSAAMNVSKGSNIIIKNNILSNLNGRALMVTANAGDSILPVIDSDYNDLFTKGDYLGYWGNLGFQNLDNLHSISNLDSNSVSFDPAFLDPEEMKVLNPALNKTGIPVDSVLVDFYGNIRDVLTPDIGAVEFDTVYMVDAGVVALNAPTMPLKTGLNDINVSIRNYGANILNDISVHFNINGVSQSTYHWIGDLGVGDTTSIALGSFEFYRHINHEIKVWTSNPNGGTDQNIANDTLTISGLKANKLNGVYTIGGTTPDFTNFNEAVNALTEGGIEGNVTFNVRDGVYTEQVLIPEIEGTEKIANNVVFQSESGDSTKVILRYAAVNHKNNYTLKLNGADGFTFRKMTIKAIGEHYGNVVVITNESDHIGLESNELIGIEDGFFFTSEQSVVTSHVAWLFDKEVTLNNHTRIINNRIIKGTNGVSIYTYNVSKIQGTVIERNTFENQSYRGIYLSNHGSPRVTGNIINSNNFNETVYKGITLTYCNEYLSITDNKVNINSDKSTHGIYLSRNDGNSDSKGLIANNMISVNAKEENPSKIYGMSLYNVTGLKVFHNSIRTDNKGDDGETAFFANESRGGIQPGIEVKNNIFTSMNGGYAAELKGESFIGTFNYNNYYSTGKTPFFLLGQGNLYNISEWQFYSNQDSNAHFVNPFFHNWNDLHIREITLSKAGIPIQEFTTDIDGQLRSTSFPSIGADEAEATAGADAGLVKINDEMGIGNNPIKVVVRNYGSDTLNTVSIGWEVNDSLQAIYNWTGNLLSGASEEVQIGTYSFGNDTSYSIKAWTYLPNTTTDVATYNDTVRIDEFYPALSGNYTIGGEDFDFPGFSSAAKALNNAGVNGPVVFNVRNGVYIEEVNLVEIKGTSEINTISFVSESGDREKVLLTHRNEYGKYVPTLQLIGTDYVTFKDMTIEATGDVNASAIVVGEGANYNTFKNNILLNHYGLSVEERDQEEYTEGYIYEGEAGDNQEVKSGAVVYFKKSQDLDEYNVFIDNKVVNGKWGIRMSGYGSFTTIGYYNSDYVSLLLESGNRIERNTFISNHNFSQARINIEFQDGIVVKDNIIRSKSSGIFMLACNNETNVLNNSIVIKLDDDEPTGANAIVINNCDGQEDSKGLIANNSIYISGNITPKLNSKLSVSIVAIHTRQSSFQNLYYNNINIETSDVPKYSAVIQLEGNFYGNGEGSNYEIKNNVLVNKKGQGFIVKNVDGSVVTDYNSYYSEIESNFGYWRSIPDTISSFESWKSITGQDQNSIIRNPFFEITDTELKARDIKLNNQAIPVVGVAIDKAGVNRDAVNPDIGAYEFDPLNNDVGIYNLKSPLTDCGLTSNENVKVIIANYGSEPQTGFNVGYAVNNGASVIENIGELIILPGEELEFTFTSKVDMSEVGNFILDVFTLLPEDQNLNNDNLNEKITGFDPFELIINNDTTVCERGRVDLKLETISDASWIKSYEWTSSDTTEGMFDYVKEYSGSWRNDYIQPGLTTTYTVKAISNNGCLAESSFTVTVLPSAEVPEISAYGPSGEETLGLIKVCAGDTVTLVSSIADSIVWSTGETTQSIIVTEEGAYTVSLKNSEDCTGTSKIMNILFEDPPFIVSDGERLNGFKTICEGTSHILSVENGKTYSWSTGQTSPSIIVNPLVTTSYTVDITNDAGCSYTDSVLVSVIGNPDIDEVTGITAICSGETTTLQVVGIGTKYFWSEVETGNLIGSSNDGTMELSPSVTTNYMIIATNEGICNLQDTAYVQVDVFESPEPPVITAPNGFKICKDGTLTLVSSIADNIMWSTGETRATIEVDKAGEYSLIYIDSLGCQVSSLAATVVEVPTPVIEPMGFTTICEGDSLVLVAKDAFNPVWSTGEETASIKISPLSETVYYLTAENELGCSYSDSIEVKVLPHIPPSAVSNMFPSDNSSGLSMPLALSWAPADNTSHYDIYIWPLGESRPDNPKVENFEQISYLYGNQLNYGVVYNWQIASKNNCFTTFGPIQTLSLRQLPDLVVENIQLPASVFSGRKATVSWEIKNTGLGNTQNSIWNDAVYLSADTVWDQQDLYVGGQSSLTALEPGQSYIQNHEFTVPEDYTGNYHVIVHADKFSKLKEANNSNNIGINNPALLVKLSPPPDLVVSSLITSGNAFSGQPLDVTWTIRNDGQAPVESKYITDAIYFATSANLSLDRTTKLGENRKQCSILKPGEEYTVSKTVILPEGVWGTGHIYLSTDDRNVVFEHAFEENNITIGSPTNIILTPPVDLIVENIIIPDSASNNQRFIVEWTVKNIGASGTNVSSWDDKVYMTESADGLEGMVYTLGTFRHVGKLDRDAYYTRKAYVTVPKNIKGAFYFYVRTDNTNNVYEFTGKSNNLGKSTSTSEVLLPDLLISKVNTPAIDTAGHYIQISYELKNGGAGDVILRRWNDRIFLSEDSVFNPDQAVLLKEFERDALYTIKAGDTKNLGFNVKIPNGTSGNYFVHVETDFNKDIREDEGEFNNVVLSNVMQVELGNIPDLLITNLVTPENAVAGDKVPISFEIKNQGIGNINNYYTNKIYISTNATWNESEAIELGTYSGKSPLESGGTYVVNPILNLPTDLTEGYHYIYVLVDEGNAVYEHNNEDNNISKSEQVLVQKYPPVDLDVVAFEVADTVTSGEKVEMLWKVANHGLASTIPNIWEDAIYISTDTLLDLDDDILIKRWQQYGPLNPSDTLEDRQHYTIPDAIEGDYYLLFHTDTANVNNDTNLDNNIKYSSVNVKMADYPDLVLTSVSMPTIATAGQYIEVKWTVTNEGDKLVKAGRWSDQIYLSTDFNIDEDDYSLRSYVSKVDLLPGGSYTDSLEVKIPIDALGNYILLIKTDNRDYIYELEREANNIGHAVLAVVQPEKADLIVSDITVPQNAKVGESVTIDWEIQNIGQNPAYGKVKDAVYFSKDSLWDKDDVLLGVYNRNINLAPLSIKAEKMIKILPGMAMGSYFVIVQTDIQNNINEESKDNNYYVSNQQVEVGMQELPLHSLLLDTLNDNQDLYYRLNIADSVTGETLLLSLKGDSLNGDNELYIKYGDVPSRSDYDYAFGNPFAGDQELKVPSLQEGTYYVFVHGKTSAGSFQEISLFAEVLGFEISSVEASEGGNTGPVTIMINGSGFEENMLALIENDSIQLPATDIIYVDETKVFATFDLTGLPVGAFDVVLINQAEETAFLFYGFNVVDGVEENLLMHIQYPSATRPNQIFTMTIQFSNNGNTDILNPLRSLISERGAPIAFSLKELEYRLTSMELEFKEPNGPQGTLRPGAVSGITIYGKAFRTPGLMKFLIVDMSDSDGIEILEPDQNQGQ